jgi:hypothetical protein
MYRCPDPWFRPGCVAAPSLPIYSGRFDIGRRLRGSSFGSAESDSVPSKTLSNGGCREANRKRPHEVTLGQALVVSQGRLSAAPGCFEIRKLPVDVGRPMETAYPKFAFHAPTATQFELCASFAASHRGYSKPLDHSWGP